MAQNKSGMELDAVDFLKSFKTLTQNYFPDAVREGLFKVVGPNVVADAIKKPPRAPHLQGHLWRSHFIKDPREVGMRSSPKAIELLVGFNTPYAAKWHEISEAKEAKINWTLAGSGRKYLENKLIFFGGDYMRKLVNFMKARIPKKTGKVNG